MPNWRSYNLDIMDRACVYGGSWDIIMNKVYTYKHGRTHRIRIAAVLPEHHAELSAAGQAKLSSKMEVIISFLDLMAHAYNIDQRLNIVTASNELAYGRPYSAQAIRDWVLDYLRHDGLCRGVTFKRRTPYSLIHDEDVRSELTQWLLVATRATPTCYARDVMNYVHSKYGVTIKLTMTLQWIKSLGFSFRSATSLELYRDGHERPDVVLARKLFVDVILKEISPYMVTFTGDDMAEEVKGNMLSADGGATEVVICVHDECNFECHDGVRMRYCKPGHGTAKQKNRGASRMISSYACASIGMFKESLKTLDCAKGHWWDGKQFLSQVPEFLAEFDRKFLKTKSACVIYDNSSNHGCDPSDALRIDKAGFNVFAGGKARPKMRHGYFQCVDDTHGIACTVKQDMYFRNGDIVLYPIGNVARTKKTPLGDGVTTNNYYSVGYVIIPDEIKGHELIGVIKGVVQTCLERKIPFDCHKTQSTPCGCKQALYINQNMHTKKIVVREFQECKTLKQSNPPRYKKACLDLMSLPDAETIKYSASIILCDCCRCVLGRQKDFLEQCSGIEETFQRYNSQHGSRHRCLFLPKFHPELNFIERIWGRMKYYVRLHCDNKFETMASSIVAAMDDINLPVQMIRRFARVSQKRKRYH